MSVIYVSSSVGLLSEEEIIDILRIARSKNDRLNITGMLLYKDGNFMQVLEGPEDTVHGLIQTIKCDPRHNGFILLRSKASDKREFSDWCMGFKNLRELTGAEVEGFSSFLTGSLLDKKFQAEPGLAFKLLCQFKQSQR